ncbi:MAG: putative BsuMI modification methylase subunit YdiP [Dehalococcoidia bacterium]|nr:putative BsuMI modification methylase subunit YdiP [Chloroflexota bacterium]
MRYLSLFSGIEATSVAFEPLGWQPVAFSEIDPHASAVLAHHWPNVPNHGDVTQFDWSVYRNAVDLVIGGSPCTTFSPMGQRQGLADPRGQLSLGFMEILRRVRPRWVIWENSCGALGSNGGSDLASILGAFTGLRITTPKRWATSGILAGIRNAYSVAWRVFDAEYFGVPQRRRRLFVVGHLGDWRPPTGVLFEPQGVSGGFETGEESSNQSTDRDPNRPRVLAFSANDHGQDIGYDVSPTLRAGGFTTSHMNGGCKVAIVHEGVDKSVPPRTLTPVEGLRLQGFPDTHLDLKYKGKPLAKCHRYKLIGNSMAVPVIRWLGERIQEVERYAPR